MKGSWLKIQQGLDEQEQSFCGLTRWLRLLTVLDSLSGGNSKNPPANVTFSAGNGKVCL
jgi:hypothetical protein